MLLCLASTVSGQSTDSTSFPSHLFRISIAGVHYQVKDQLVAPLRWDGTGGALGFSYLTSSKWLINEFNFQIPVGILSNRYDHRGYAWEINVSYTGLHKIQPSIMQGNLSLGMQIRWDANCQFYADWDDAHLYWLNVYDLGPVLKWSKDYSASWITISMHLPLFALFSRPPENQIFDQADLILPSYYFKTLHENLRPASVNEYISLNMKTEYMKQVNKKTILGVTWLFNYQSCRIPQNISIITNTIMFNYSIIIGKNNAK
jgi:hypothetical protein